MCGKSFRPKNVPYGKAADSGRGLTCGRLATMKPSQALQLNRVAVREIALRHRVRNIRVFGSVLRGEDTEDSDLDILVEPTAETTLMDIGAIRFELRKLLGFNVDVLTPNALPDRFKDQILIEAVPV